MKIIVNPEQHSYSSGGIDQPETSMIVPTNLLEVNDGTTTA